MGCCLSTTVTATPAEPPDHDAVATQNFPEKEVVDQEETVKEVLSETQTPSTSLAKIGNTTHENNSDGVKKPVEEEPETSFVSEMYSISGSFSATTIHDGDEAGEVNQRIVHLSPAKKRSSCVVNARAKRGGLRSLEPSNPRVITKGYKSPGPSSEVLKSRPARGRTACSTLPRRNVGLVEGSGRRSVASSSAASQVIRSRRPAVSSSVSGVTGCPGGRSQREGKQLK
uniref:Uncharacterized protein n=1 Tax=Daucus carota subsp. sativus TaxID=79200 RepID=A0A165Z5U2_DAUCS